MDTRKLLAELIGTFVFFLTGFLSILATNAVSSTIDLVVIAFGFGLGLFAAIQIAGAISGGHFNPAVTIGALLDKRIDPVNAVGYLIAQLIGGLGAAGLVLLISSQAAVAGTRTVPGAGISDLQALVLETVFTAIFVAVILTVTKLKSGPGVHRDPADPRGDPRRPDPAHRILGQPGPLDCTGGHRR